ncbi:lysozyme inhibitor LprI family protein [Methylobacterium sp. J-030]|uniref:lysozyme inhibitor LprI family protein n=1 Tax=Methylobacterium sp. J-030 TaxID=2836627 RepID=UPI001FB95AF5|nr:lysozyme inhibitor LprI family protein [Methylobacterium sp. J-030]MCJ2071888.1 lysozyme inhibitor LprI family protein [Methylobacterium sp. J-030]
MRRSAICLAAFLLAAAPASAAAPCAGSTQMDLNACAAAAYDRADAAMNAAYGKLMKQIGPKAKDGLRAAQKAWLPFRDASCTLEATGAEGGSMQPQVRANCLARVTAARTKMLTGYLTCAEADVICVGGFGE